MLVPANTPKGSRRTPPHARILSLSLYRSLAAIATRTSSDLNSARTLAPQVASGMGGGQRAQGNGTAEWAPGSVCVLERCAVRCQRAPASINGDVGSPTQVRPTPMPPGQHWSIAALPRRSNSASAETEQQLRSAAGKRPANAAVPLRRYHCGAASALLPLPNSDAGRSLRCGAV